MWRCLLRAVKKHLPLSVWNGSHVHDSRQYLDILYKTENLEEKMGCGLSHGSFSFSLWIMVPFSFLLIKSGVWEQGHMDLADLLLASFMF
jgi:hypothetical protein